MPQIITTPSGRRIAFQRTPGQGPGIVFLGGFRSDMEGTKALYLQHWAAASGRGFLRFDYSGHGQSGGRFEEGCIGDWLDDARAVIEAQTEGPQVLVGSSMGGWIALLLVRALPARVAALVGIAAAPDFTERGFWASFTAAEREELMRDGVVQQSSEYGEPLPITRRLIEDGRRHLLLDSPLMLPVPVRLLQGSSDAEVPLDWALRLLEHADCRDMRLTIVKGADHRFSSADCLALIARTVAEVTAPA